MLSPGKWHKRVPKEPVENLKFRRFLLSKCRNAGSPEAIRAACKSDLLFWVNCFVFQYNPAKLGDEVGPFITWPFQDAALTYGDGKQPGLLGCIEDQKDLVVEKSRDMGASWMFLIVADWLARFHRGKKLHMISRSADLVDDVDNSDSLFWKLDFLHRHLPSFFQAGVKRRKMSFSYEETGSAITGEASTGRAGVGGRATAMFVDEFAQIKEDYEVLHRTSDTTRCRIFNSTHLGTDTAFFDLAQRRPDIRKLVIHWTQHPEKSKGLYRYDTGTGAVEILDRSYNFYADFDWVMEPRPTGGPYPGIRSPWYDEQCERKGSDRAVAMDLDINPQGSVSQFFDPLMIHQLKATYCCDPYWEGEIHYDRDTGKFDSLIGVAGGHLKLWLHVTSDGAKVPCGRYAMGGDLSAGTGATPSCFSIVNQQTGEKVAEYTNAHITPEQLAPLAVALCGCFADGAGNGALFAWEHQGPGVVFGKKVIELGYRNVYYRTDDFDLRRVVSDTPGWVASPNNKRTLLEEYRAALNSRQFVNHSIEALTECLAFRYAPNGNVEHGEESGGDNPSGARVNHGDHVIADGLAWKMARGKGARAPQPIEETPVGSFAWRREYRYNLARQQERR